MDIIQKLVRSLPAGMDASDLKSMAPESLWQKKPELAAITALYACEFLDWQNYLEKYEDVELSGLDPIVHFVKYGIHEGRSFEGLLPQIIGDSVRTANPVYTLDEKINGGSNPELWKKWKSEEQKRYLYDYKISVIIPAYNAEKYLNRTLNSILNQSLKDVEIIVYNDCSEDNTLEIIKEYSTNYKNIKYITSEINTGQGIGRNKALEIASGKYVTYLDADDYFNKENYLERFYREIEKSDVDVVIGPYLREIKGELIKDKVKAGSFDGIEAGVKFLAREFGTHAPGAKLIKSDLAKSCRFAECGFSQDVIYNFDMLMHAEKVKVINEYGYVYYNDNISSWRPEKLTIKHLYSSFRVLCEIINRIFTYRNYGITFGYDKFIKLWKEDHLGRIISYSKTDKFNDIEGLLKEYGSLGNIVLHMAGNSIKFNNYININRDELSLNNLEKRFVGYIKRMNATFKQNLNSAKDYKKNAPLIVIYASHLANGGLERVAAELGDVLMDAYDVIYLLDNKKQVDYEVKNKILEADLSNIDVLNYLHQAKYIFDFKYKKPDREYALPRYIVENYYYKYIPTIHNTKTCACYFEKIQQYLKDVELDLSMLANIICVSEAVKREFNKLYGESSNISVVYNPVDSERIANEPVMDLGFDYILFSGRLNATEHKGIDLLLEAFIKSSIYKKCKLVMAGAGELTEEMQKYIELNDHDKQIQVIGFKSNIHSYMKGAKFIVAPSRWEGFSMTIIESLACGTPVLTSPAGGALEIIKNDYNGYVYKMEDIDDLMKGLEHLLMNGDKLKNNCVTSILSLNKDNYNKKINKLFIDT